MIGGIKNLFIRISRKNTRKVFTNIYKQGAWKSKETISGPGSRLDHTSQLRLELPAMLLSMGIRSLLDAPCGDYNWMSQTDLEGIDYTGADIVPDLIAENQKRYPGIKFIIADIIKDPLPVAEAILCRDCFIHLNNAQVIRAIRNFKKSNFKFLITNTSPIDENKNVLTGDFRPVNLEKAPFLFPAPLKKIKDHIEGEPVRWLGLWELKEIRL